LRGELKQMESMDKHTSWKTGGVVKHFYRPADRDDLCNFLAEMPGSEALAWVGLGSNLLVRDGGFDGTVIHTKGCLTGLMDIDDQRFTAEAGVSCAVAARHAARKGLTGLEFFAGIPGTVGGALAMNAGAFGGETWRCVESVEMVNRNGQIINRSPDEFVISYRHVGLPESDEWFLSATFRLQAGDTEAAQNEIRKLLDRRGSSQPIGEHSCGSTFKNPPGDHAARLIESCGLKGHCVGGACVSQKHANFVINTGNASATDIETLVEMIEQTVKEKTGVQLEREFHTLGNRRGLSKAGGLS
jgi:UDP-N-acetylmuramate dehydrogenase